MRLTPSEKLTESEVKSGMNFVIKEGLTTEAVTTLTGGAFLVAMALKLGASNFQIGLLASIPTLSNIFQLLAIFCLQRFRNRRYISVISAFFARVPLIFVAALPFLFTAGTSLTLLISFLFVHFFFSTVTNLSWTSWMKDLIPEDKLGSYFSHRSRLIQIISVILSFSLALVLDYVKEAHPNAEMMVYSIMFFSASLIGFAGIYFFTKTPEPKMELSEDISMLKFFKKPLRDKNFKKFLLFNSFWAFATNLAIPFYSVYLITVLDVSLSYIIGLNILSQFSSIMLIRHWGKLSDKYSNKTILSFCGPLYIISMLIWPYTTMPDSHVFTFPLLIIIFILMGIANAGINLSLANIGYKLTPKSETVTYFSTRTMVTAFFTASAPIIAGFFADFFAVQELNWEIQWKGSEGDFMIPLIKLENWDFFFFMGACLAAFSLRKLNQVSESGEVHKHVMVSEVKLAIQKKTRQKAVAISNKIYKPASFAKRRAI
ncbi:MAG: MFS transporter, partial [Bacteroidetes bacterium]|nr:MFS transporter [Bacteroidota bacterium]